MACNVVYYEYNEKDAAHGMSTLQKLTQSCKFVYRKCHNAVSIQIFLNTITPVNISCFTEEQDVSPNGICKAPHIRIKC